MKILASIACLILLSNLEMKAQDYVPFPTDSASWYQSTLLLGFDANEWSHSSVEQAGDTLINDTLYRSIYFVDNPNTLFQTSFYAGGLREDNNKKIYFRTSPNWTGSSQDFFRTFAIFSENDTEYLIYDFEDVQIGDSLHYENDVYELGDYSYIVQDIDSVLVGSIYRKKYELQDNVLGQYNNGVGYDTSYFIEGLGSSLGLLAPYKTGEGGFFFNTSQLSCFETQGYSFTNQLHEEVTDCQLGLSIEELSASHLLLYPNPTTNNLFIESSSSPINSVHIHSQSGKLVYSDIEIQSKSLELDLSLLESGMYFIQITDGDGSITKKLIRE